MSYELSRVPGGGTSTQSTRLHEAAVAQPSAEEVSPKVVNARPISAMPPDPRDTTLAIEKEARASRYGGRGAAEPVADHTPPAHARIVEGRELVLPSNTAPASEIETRISVTREWLSSAPPSTHTIQIMGTNNDAQLTADLKNLERLLDPGKIYVFRTLALGKPSKTVVYGAYADRASAVQALSKLPSAVAVNQPVLRTVKGIRAEIASRMSQGGS